MLLVASDLTRELFKKLNSMQIWLNLLSLSHTQAGQGKFKRIKYIFSFLLVAARDLEIDSRKEWSPGFRNRQSSLFVLFDLYWYYRGIVRSISRPKKINWPIPSGSHAWGIKVVLLIILKLMFILMYTTTIILCSAS